MARLQGRYLPRRKITGDASRDEGIGLLDGDTLESALNLSELTNVSY